MPKRKIVIQEVLSNHHSFKECALCGFTTKTDTAVKLHIKFVHGKIATNANANESNTCCVCLKTFDTKEKALTHLKSHKIRV